MVYARWILLVFLWAVSVPELRANWKVGQASVRLLPGPQDAYALAWLDCQGLPPVQRSYTRYLWVEDARPESGYAASLALNLVSRSPEIKRPVAIGKGELLLMRVDLRWYAPTEQDKRDLARIWEDFQYDPKFHLLLTKDTVSFALRAFPEWTGKGLVARWKVIGNERWIQDGKEVFGRWQLTPEIEDIRLDRLALQEGEVARLPHPLIDPAVYYGLIEATGSQAPVVYLDYFVARGLSTIQDKGLYAVLYGGRYYQLAGIGKGFKKGTDEDNFFESLGIGNVEAGITADQLFDKLRSDRRAAVFRSGVTGSPRQVAFFKSLVGILVMTRDLKKSSIDIGTHPAANLLAFKHDGTEGLFDKSNGLQGAVLFDGKGALVDSVPDDIAKDHTVNAPNTARLESAISCIACHWAKGNDGWLPFANDVKTIKDSGLGLSVLGQVKGQSTFEVIRRLNGLYGADPDSLMKRPRDDLAAAVLAATGPWPGLKSQTDVAKHAGQHLVAVSRGYFHESVTQQRALRELRVVVDEKHAKEVFSVLLQPDPRSAIYVPELEDTVVPEDFRVAALRSGLPVVRADFDLAYGFMADRVAKVLKTLPRDDGQPKQKNQQKKK